MTNLNQQPSDKTPPKRSFLKIGLQIYVALILLNVVRAGISAALTQPSYSPSSTLELSVPPHVQAMHDNMSCDTLRYYSKLREWKRRGCDK